MDKRSSIYVVGQKEAEEYKWIESEKAGCDLGQAAIKQWVRDHWDGFLRARWLEHLHGTRFWEELDRGDFGILQSRFQDKSLLLDRILDRLKVGKENLDIVQWALDFNVTMAEVREILEALDINSRRLVCRFNA